MLVLEIGSVAGVLVQGCNYSIPAGKPRLVVNFKLDIPKDLVRDTVHVLAERHSSSTLR